MFKICVCGAGKIGRFVAVLLARSDEYHVMLIDQREPDSELQHLCELYPGLDYCQSSLDSSEVIDTLLMRGAFNGLISCLPFTVNLRLAQAAHRNNLHYFDLSEDRETQQAIAKVARGAQTAFVPQCGVAPGFVDVMAHHLLQQFDHLKSAKLSVGALPQQVSNSLHYELSWSIEGLVNEYINPCEVISKGRIVEVPALSELEILNLEGRQYEIFHTSGGLGTLADFYQDKIDELHYKTIRYQGHVDAIQKLFQAQQYDRKKIINWFAKNIPFTKQDMVLMYITVTGKIENNLEERSFMRKWYAKSLDDIEWTAIQWTTASEIAAVCDMVMDMDQPLRGLVKHQDIPFDRLVQNRFMDYYDIHTEG